MATWSLEAQLTAGSPITVGSTDRIWWNGALWGDNVVVGQYQDSTHISDSSDVHTCSTNHVHNTKYVDATQLSQDGDSPSLLADVVEGDVGLKFTFSDASAVATSGGKFYAYDGSTDATPIGGIDFRAFEQGDSSWTAANGLGAALVLSNQAAATDHDFYIGTSVSPTSTGAKAGKIKITLTYV